jgi:hypothetical protein
MVERRPLTAGLERSVEEQFVRTGKLPSPDSVKTPEPTLALESKGAGTNHIGRAPLTTRIRSDFGAALKRASLERQLSGTKPNTLQDILEEALEPWLRKNGYLQ